MELLPLADSKSQVLPFLEPFRTEIENERPENRQELISALTDIYGPPQPILFFSKETGWIDLEHMEKSI